MPEERYCFDWWPGGSGQLEIRAPVEGGRGGEYRYTPPFRATLRPPFDEAQFKIMQDLGPIYSQLDKVADWFRRGNSRKVGQAPMRLPVGNPEDELKTLGQLLLTLVLPPRVGSELQLRDLYLEIGTDESLLDLPWELMFNGEDYLCARNFVGRFVNLSKAQGAPQQRVAPVYGVELEQLRILLISVPEPDPVVLDGKRTEYPSLSAAKSETEAIIDTLAYIPYVKLDVLQDATFLALFGKLQAGAYDIIHYVGHAVSNPADPNSSGIILQDRMLTTGLLSSVLGARPPVFCFLNGCETTRLEGHGWRGKYSLFGLASAILSKGSYLLGSTWEIDDYTAATFASHFYRCFLEGNSLGFATREARLKVRDPQDPTDLGWASYTFYGDPRLFLRPAVGATMVKTSGG